jgi:CBS domain-containing protein
VNLILATFNLIPAFPMDGGRILRALLARRMSYQQATRIAVNLGHVFALIFGYLGVVQMNIILIAVAIFIYMAASSEELMVDVRETLKKFRIRDILPREFLTLKPDATLSDVLELVLHSHQEDFPVLEAGAAVGFVTRQDIITAIHQYGTSRRVAEIMRRTFPRLSDHATLTKARTLMEEHGIKALPVFKGDEVVGVVTLEDIGRVYAMMSTR